MTETTKKLRHCIQRHCR